MQNTRGLDSVRSPAFSSEPGKLVTNVGFNPSDSHRQDCEINRHAKQRRNGLAV